MSVKPELCEFPKTAVYTKPVIGYQVFRRTTYWPLLLHNWPKQHQLAQCVFEACNVVVAGVWQDHGVQGHGGGPEGGAPGQPGWHHHGGHPGQQEGGSQGGLL